jgi:hypothetical protein
MNKKSIDSLLHSLNNILITLLGGSETLMNIRKIKSRSHLNYGTLTPRLWQTVPRSHLNYGKAVTLTPRLWERLFINISIKHKLSYDSKTISKAYTG